MSIQDIMPCSSVWLFGFNVCNVDVSDEKLLNATNARSKSRSTRHNAVKHASQLITRFYSDELAVSRKHFMPVFLFCSNKNTVNDLVSKRYMIVCSKTVNTRAVRLKMHCWPLEAGIFNLIFICNIQIFYSPRNGSTKKQRQTEYNETYTQITVKHYKRDKKTNILLKPISNISNYMIIAELTFT